MIRGLYTGACAMLARDTDTAVISNNLANMNTVAYKRDTAVFKDFPAMLLHRQNDELIRTAFGDFDPMPVVGRAGTGVEVNDIVTEHEMGPLQETGEQLDFALVGQEYAFFTIQTPAGVRYTRSGDLDVNEDGDLVDSTGSLVLGENGPIPVDRNNFAMRDDGTIMTNASYTGEGENLWENPIPVDRLRLVAFENPAGLRKRGNGLYEYQELAGGQREIAGTALIRQGYLERSNVNIVRELVDLITAQRNYEQSARVIQTEDQLLQMANTQVGRA